MDAPVTAGFFALLWEAPEGAGGQPEFELQESGSSDFANAETIYRGGDEARTVTGKPDGAFYYRVRMVEGGEPGAWSSTLSVAVRHHALGKAFAYFGIGAFVFLASLFTILFNARKQA